MQLGNILGQDTEQTTIPVLHASVHDSYLVKSLSTSYSYLIHVLLYTKNSRKARTAMRVNAITDTRENMETV